MKKSKVAFIVIFIAVGVLGLFLWFRPSSGLPGQYDDFAKCLSEKNVNMYGAFWCPHCNNQKKLFGDSWQYMNYVECSTPDGRGQTQICKDQNIESYPTWEFPDGKRLSGELRMSDISRLSGCMLSQ